MTRNRREGNPMIETWQKQAFAFGKQFADTAFKAQNAVLKGFEQISDAQLKALQAQTEATAAFVAESADVRDADAARALWNKGLDVARANAEQGYVAGQQVAAVVLKTADALGELARAQLKAANEAFTAPAAAKKAAH